MFSLFNDRRFAIRQSLNSSFGILGTDKGFPDKNEIHEIHSYIPK